MWNKEVFGSVRQNLQLAQARLNKLQDIDPLSRCHDVHKQARNEVQKWLERKEQLWRQRSQITWLADCYRNTHFFHNKASQWKRTNHIGCLKNHARVWQTEHAWDKLILEYFRELFTLQLRTGLFSTPYRGVYRMR